MTTCHHSRRACLNHYDTIRKYICEDCGVVHICACDEPLAMQFLPHQTRVGTEFGTRERYPVSGFVPDLCPACRGETEIPHPMAAVRGRKGKIERFYWREITKTFHGMARDWLCDRGYVVSDILEFGHRFPEVRKELRIEARVFWQERHKTAPKYELSEPTQQQLREDFVIPEAVASAPYQKVDRRGHQLGRWVGRDGELVSGEVIASEFYESRGWQVHACERNLISTLYASFCFPVVQDARDPRLRIGYRNSTKGWTSHGPETRPIAISLPEDFGGPHHFERRRSQYDVLFRDLLCEPLLRRFESQIEDSENLRDYLSVNKESAVDLARAAIQAIPDETIVGWLRWVAGDFWGRQPGWPDLLLLRDGAFRFSEVKTPHDSLSQEQIAWFRWALGEAQIPCEICRIRKAT